MSRFDLLLSGLSNLSLRSSTVRDDDAIDQLHHFVTVSLLVLFAAVTGLVEYASVPIDCYNYGGFLWQHYQTHVNSYCWNHNLYYYPDPRNHSVVPYPVNAEGAAEDPTVLDQGEQLGQVSFTGYRWVTVIFIVQALFFKIPQMLWGELNAYTGTNIARMVEMLKAIVWAKPEEKKERISQVAFFLEQWLRMQSFPNWFQRARAKPSSMSSCTLCIGSNLRNYLSNVYLLTKAIYLINIFVQFIILSLFLKLNFWTFGSDTVEAYRNVDTKRDFPLIVLCHFQTFGTKADADTVQDVATGKWVQCVLNINLFLEKMFLVEWVWLLVLLVLTVISFVTWCFKICRTQVVKKFVKRYMRLMGTSCPTPRVPNTCSEEEFILGYLRNDGVFVLRILAINTNEVVVSELVEECWARYLKIAENKKGDLEVIEMETDAGLEKDVSAKNK